MAINTHNVSRRQTLVGFGIAAASGAVPTVILADDTSAWDEAFAWLRHCEAAVQAYAPHLNAADDRYTNARKNAPQIIDANWLEGARNTSGYDEAERRHDALMDRFCAARDRLLEMPAPHAKALLWKLEYFMGDTIYSEAFTAPTIADMRRLLGAKA